MQKDITSLKQFISTQIPNILIRKIHKLYIVTIPKIISKNDLINQCLDQLLRIVATCGVYLLEIKKL